MHGLLILSIMLDKIIKSNYKLKNKDLITVEMPDPVELNVEPEKMDLDIVYEDEEYVTSYMILGIFLFLFGLRIIFLYI